MADSEESRMNLAALRRVDPNITQILGTATQVAMYKFDAQANAWEKTDIEGSLFVYARSGDPHRGFLIMNRLSTKNMVEPVTKDLDLQLNEPFLLYRNSQLHIYGVWFYDKSECITIGEMIKGLCEEAARKSHRQPDMRQRNNHTNVDIMSMLTKAQGEFDQRKMKRKQLGAISESNPGGSDAGIIKPLAVRAQPTSKTPEATSQSVMDFFAKVSSGQQQLQQLPQKPLPPPQQHQPRSHTVSEHVGMLANTPLNGTRPMVLRSVSLTEQEPSAFVHGGGKNELTLPVKVVGESDSKQESPQGMNPVLQRLLSNPVHSVEHIEKQQLVQTAESALEHDLKAKLNLLPSTPSTQEEKAVGKATPGQGYYAPPGDEGLRIGHQVGSPAAAPPPPLPLMSPMMFATTSKTEGGSERRPGSGGPVANGAACTIPGLLQVNGRACEEQRPLPEVEPLTRVQMLQALNYLLKNDPEFVTKLHEAYVMSLNQSMRSMSS